MKQFRLALVRQKYRPDGGAERFIARTLEALNLHNIQLNVITRQWQGGHNPAWNIHICDPWKWGRISRERGFARAARHLWQSGEFDLVQSHERIAGCDIYRAGDGVHQRWLKQRARILPGWLVRRLFLDSYHRHIIQTEREMYASETLQAVICNSHMIKQQIMEDFALPEQKISVIYNPVNCDEFTPADEQQVQQLRRQWQLPQQASCLLFVGSGFERKGLAAAIRALAPTDKHLLVVGKDKTQARYQSLAKSLHCEQRIHFFGVHVYTLPFYQMADGLLLPTLYDPFPNVILEALACGLPVITSAHCGGKEFIRQGKNGYVCDALDISALQQAIMALPARAAGSAESQHARTSVQHCTMTRLSGELIALYQKTMEDKCASC